jgi:hypothetical protein
MKSEDMNRADITAFAASDAIDRRKHSIAGRLGAGACTFAVRAQTVAAAREGRQH